MDQAAILETNSVISELANYVSLHFLTGGAGRPLGEDDSLVERGVIDSTGILELVTFVEEHFKVRIEDQDLVPENFDSLRRLASFVERKKSHAA